MESIPAVVVAVGRGERSFCRQRCSRLLARFLALTFCSAVGRFCRPLFPEDTWSSLGDPLPRIWLC